VLRGKGGDVGRVASCTAVEMENEKETPWKTEEDWNDGIKF